MSKAATLSRLPQMSRKISGGFSGPFDQRQIGSNSGGQVGQPLRGLLEGLDLFAEREPRHRFAQLRPGVEAHPGDGRDSDLLRQPYGKLARLEIRDLRKIRQYIVGA